MKILIKRTHAFKGAIDGELYIGTEKVCDTAEHATCMLPEGEYRVEMKKSDKHERIMPHITSKEHCGILSYGFGVYNVPSGTIIVGTHRTYGLCIQTKPMLEYIYQRIDKALERKEEVTLIIQEDLR